MKIRSFTQKDVTKVKEFTDRAIGTNYYTAQELHDIYQKSLKNGQECTLLLEDGQGEIRGVRITFPPGQWQKGKGKGLNPTLWKVPQNDVAYFQRLFVDPALTGQGWGKKMSLKAIEMLKKLGTRAIVTHSWKESPHDSSGKYLRALGFRVVASHPFYWKDVDYVCTRCGKPCVCTAEEMILPL
jgi:ribosomal protein S18 acetylase RimI-like enzyme